MAIPKCLPPKLFIQTLLRLPVTSLLRFKCVSKQLHALLSNPTFIALHAIRSKSTNNGYLLQDCQSDFSRCDGNLLQFDQQLTLPMSSSQIVGSCHGLVCLLLDTFSTCRFPLYLWNPSLRIFRKLPDHRRFIWEEEWSNVPSKGFSSFLAERKPTFATFAITGFGYDHRSNDFKVLLIVNAREIATEPFRQVFDEMQIYSLRTNAWRRIVVDVTSVPCPNSASMVYLNGGLHWLATKKETKAMVVVSFSFGDEVFRDRSLPDHEGEASIGILKDSVALFISNPAEEDYNGLGICHVHALKQHGGVEFWVKMFTVDLRAHIGYEFLGFGVKGEVLLRNGDGELVLYDPETQGIVGCEGSNWVANAVTYAESLVSP